MKRTKKLTIAALSAALTVVILWLGSALEVLDLSMAVVASLLVVFAHIELGRPYQYLLWLVASVLSLLLIGISGATLAYAAFAGFYPILKARFERWPRPLEWLAKLLTFALGVLLFLLVAKLLLLLPTESTPLWMQIAFFVLLPLVFVLYDIALSKLILFYSFRIRPRLLHLFK